MKRFQKSAFSPTEFLANAGIGRRIVELRKAEALFSQGDKADSVFFIQKGRAKLSVVSKSGNLATFLGSREDEKCERLWVLTSMAHPEGPELRRFAGC